MARDLFDMYQDEIGDQLVNQASSILGEPAQSISSAMGLVLPALIGSLIQKGGTEAGAKGLMDFLTVNNFDGSLLPKVGGLLSRRTATDSLMSAGASVLKYLIGDKLGSLIDLISDSGKVKTSSAASLLKMTAPLLLSILGKHIKRNGLAFDGLKEFLLSQRGIVMKSVAPGISDLLGFAGLAELGDGIESSMNETTSKMVMTESEAKPMLNKLLPWLVLLLAALAMFYFLGRGCAGAKTRKGDVLESTEKSVNDITISAVSVDTQAQMIKKDVGSVAKSDSETGDNEVVTGLAQLSKALAAGSINSNTPYILDKIKFQGKSAVLTSPSEAELAQLAKILKANPTAHIRIEAHTDNSGNADINRQLSTQQALSVMTFLKSSGVDLNRMSTIGRGQTKPLVPNDTDAGKEQNKRVEIYVVK